jgi:hypothetical protein
MQDIGIEFHFNPSLSTRMPSLSPPNERHRLARALNHTGIVIFAACAVAKHDLGGSAR